LLKALSVSQGLLPVTNKKLEDLTAEDLQPYGVFLTGVPELIPPIEDNLWTVVKDIIYVCPDGTVVKITAGTKTDLASTPNWAKAFYGGPGKETVGSVVHDEGYKDPDRPRFNVLIMGYVKRDKAFWDEIFLVLMRATKTEPSKRNSYYIAVKCFGWFVWFKNKWLQR
jgi:hypothetical protein